jgi:DNA-binding NarL/FixJ family response regulator
MFKVLIVEDNRLFSEALRAALQTHFPFLELMKAAGVEEAIAKVDSTQPDLIITDIRLPDGNGLDFTRSIRAAGIESVIIVLSSHDLPEYREKALNSGADHFMSKGSIDISDIFGVVESILASRFRVLIVAEDATFREQMEVFLSRGWPRTVGACAGDWEQALETVDTLKPDLVVVRSEANTEWDRRFREAFVGLRAGGNTAVVRVGDADFADACPVDHRIESGAEFSQAMVMIIDLTLAARADRLKH